MSNEQYENEDLDAVNSAEDEFEENEDENGDEFDGEPQQKKKIPNAVIYGGMAVVAGGAAFLAYNKFMPSTPAPVVPVAAPTQTIPDAPVAEAPTIDPLEAPRDPALQAPPVADPFGFTPEPTPEQPALAESPVQAAPELNPAMPGDTMAQQPQEVAPTLDFGLSPELVQPPAEVAVQQQQVPVDPMMSMTPEQPLAMPAVSENSAVGSDSGSALQDVLARINQRMDSIDQQLTQINAPEIQNTLSTINTRLTALENGKVAVIDSKPASSVEKKEELKKADTTKKVKKHYAKPKKKEVVLQMTVQAVIPGRVYIKTDAGHTSSYAVGEVLPNGAKVSSINPDTGVVKTSKGTIRF